MARQKTFAPYDIQQAFRKLRESLALDFGVDYANGDNFCIREIEKELMDILLPPKNVDVAKKVANLDKLKNVSLDEFNNELFG